MSKINQTSHENFQEEVKSIASLVTLTQNVEFFVYDGMGLFTSKNEKFQNPAYKLSNPEKFIFDRQCQSLNQTQTSSQDLSLYLKPIINQLTDKKLNFTVLDVGGYIGIFSLKAGSCCRQLKLDTKIFCFEPGPTTHLIEANININDFTDTITLVEKAASYVTGPVLYHYQPNTTIAGRLFQHGNASYSKIIQSQKLDDFLDTNELNYDVYLIKIDTEGYECNVLKGLLKTMETKPCIFVLEFWPWTLDYQINGQKYGDYLTENFIIIDIDNSVLPKKFDLIEPDNFLEFAQAIKSSSRRCTDILCLPKSLPDVNILVDQISRIS